MTCDEIKTINDCKDDPTLIFKLIKEEKFSLVDELLTKKIVDINTVDDAGNDVLTRLLKVKSYDLVLKHMKNTSWDTNHQNIDGNTFAHYLVSINYVEIIDIINRLRRKREFTPNIKNKKGETILDKSINENYIYTTLKVLKDKRFNDITITSFKRIFDAYIKSSCYGKYSKINNLEIIIGSLDKKELLPGMQDLINQIKDNKDVIKKEIMKNNLRFLESIININLVKSV